MRDSGNALIESLGVTPGLKVLDLGCGDGTTAVPAAQRGAEVVGVDIAANLVAAGNARAKALGLANLRFEEGDASQLTGIADASFDLVVSMFGAMFAPRLPNVAREMVRVTRPGGRIVMGNWIAGDPTLVAQVLKISAAYTPPPPESFISPVSWGNEAEVVARFTAAGVAADSITCTRDTYVFEGDMPPTAFLDIFQNFYGPTMNAFAAAEAAGRLPELRAELEALFTAQNQSADPGHTRIPATFLRVTVTKP
jgi:SAM-dependent methyltransferase